MIFYRAVGEAARAMVFAARGVLRAPVREPFFVVGGLQLIVLLLLGFFHIPAFVGAMAPVVRLLGGESALHYPEHFWQLPELYRDANLFLAVGFTWTAWAVATARFANRPGNWSSAFRRSGSYMTVGLVVAGGSWLITTLFDLIPKEVALYSFIVRMGLQGIELLMIVTLEGLFAFALPTLVLAESNVRHALSASARRAKRMPLTLLVLYGLPAALLFPLTFFMYEMSMEEAGLTPEAVGLLMTVRIVVRVLLDVLVIGGATALYLERTGRKA